MATSTSSPASASRRAGWPAIASAGLPTRTSSARTWPARISSASAAHGISPFTRRGRSGRLAGRGPRSPRPAGHGVLEAAQRARVERHAARPVEAARHGGERPHQPLGEVGGAVHRHAGAGLDRHAAGAGDERVERPQLVHGDARRSPPSARASNGSTSVGEPADDSPRRRTRRRNSSSPPRRSASRTRWARIERVGAGTRREVEVGVAGALGAPRVDHDDASAAGTQVAEVTERVRHHHAVAVRHDGVHADGQQQLGARRGRAGTAAARRPSAAARGTSPGSRCSARCSAGGCRGCA